jgi:acyl-coenzyme A thioesterase PaaI-like protein
MPAANPLRAFAKKAISYPTWLRQKLLTWMFRYKVKLTGTVSIDIIETDLKSVTFRQKNYKKVQNHIGSVHAAAMALLAESSTGFVVGVNLPGDKLPLIKEMNLKYVKRAKGDMQAVARLTDAQIELMQTQDKGEIAVAVTVTDAQGIEPVICEMIWAWVPKSAA